MRKPRQFELLLTLVLLQVGQSFLSAESVIQRAAFNLLFLVVVVSATRAQTRSRSRMLAAAVVGGVGYAMACVSEFSDSAVLVIATHLCYVFVFVTLILSIADSVFTEGDVDLNRILGAVNIYLILGLVFALVFALLQVFQPGSFDLSASNRTGFDVSTVSEMIYFSNVTLTTLGYGDVVPISRPAKTLATLEAMMGQLYLAVVVGRLVGLHIAQTREA